MSSTLTPRTLSLALKEPSPRTRTVVEYGHHLGAVGKTLEHPVEAVNDGIRGERRDPDRAERGGVAPRPSDLADVAWANEPRAQVGLVDEDPHRWIALRQRIELLEQLH